MSSDSADTLVQVITLLRPLSDDERARTIRAALTFLGTPDVPLTPAAAADAAEAVDLPAEARRWMKQHGVTAAHLETVYHPGGGDYQLIASTLPGDGPKEQTRQCYLLHGVRGLLTGGEPRVDDKAVRLSCRQFGCYDSTNHTKYVRSLGNAVVAENGEVKLTQPGLKAAADLVRQLAAGRG